MVTVAPEMTALVWSVIVPAIVPSDVVCADTELVVKSNADAQSTTEKNRGRRPCVLGEGSDSISQAATLTPTAAHMRREL